MRKMRLASWQSVMGMLVALLVPCGVEAGTLDDVKAHRNLVCGVSIGVLGFSAQDNTSRWSGFDVDFCRAIAAVVLGDATKVSFIPSTASSRFDVLKGGGIDLLSRNTAWTMSRDTGFGLAFAAITLFDGQASTRRAASSRARWIT